MGRDKGTLKLCSKVHSSPRQRFSPNITLFLVCLTIHTSLHNTGAMPHGVTLKAVRDELAALGHNLSEGVVASLLVDAGAAGLLQEALDEVDGSDLGDTADYDGTPSENRHNTGEGVIQSIPEWRSTSRGSSVSCDGDTFKDGPLRGMMDDDDGNVCSCNDYVAN
jgi:hypothetical protein